MRSGPTPRCVQRNVFIHVNNCLHLQLYLSIPLPTSLPVRRTAGEVKAAFPQQFEFQGFCVVTYVDGGSTYDSLVPGVPNLAVEFESQLYAFASEDKVHC